MSRDYKKIVAWQRAHQLLYIALASLKETEYFLLLSYDLGYLNKPDYEELTELANSTFAPLHGLMKSVKKEMG